MGNSHFCKLDSLKLVMLWDDLLKLGNYLGPSIVVGLAMTTMILTQNGQKLHTLTCGNRLEMR